MMAANLLRRAAPLARTNPTSFSILRATLQQHSKRSYAVPPSKIPEVSSVDTVLTPPGVSQIDPLRARSTASSTAGITETLASSSSAPPPSPPPPPPKKEKHRLRTFARSVLVVVLSSAGYVVYKAYTDRHPPEQLDHDPEKKTIVVLGNGWGATSFLKGLDTEDYNVVVISPRNYFCFTPLLPSVTVGTVDSRSVIEPTRFITRHKKRRVEVYEAKAEEVDPINKTVKISDNSILGGEKRSTVIAYDYLVYAVGAENNTFGIPGVKENACFLKEVWDAEKIRTKLMDCIETATFKGQSQEEISRLLHMVVVGGGPTGVEYAAELHDFLVDDLSTWYPEIAGKVKITLVEALPNVLPMFSKQLIDYTTQTFSSNRIDVLTKTMVKGVDAKTITAQNEKKETVEIPYGLLVWATGNTSRDITKKLMTSLSTTQTQRRGLLVDDHLRLLGAEDIFALGDCTATAYAPTAQAASQQGLYLARTMGLMSKQAKLEEQLVVARKFGATEDVDSLVKVLNRTNIREFKYTHQGSLAYIGSDKAIADVPFFQGNLASGGVATYVFWRSAYISMTFSFRNRALVCTDWLRVKLFGRSIEHFSVPQQNDYPSRRKISRTPRTARAFRDPLLFSRYDSRIPTASIPPLSEEAPIPSLSVTPPGPLRQLDDCGLCQSSPEICGLYGSRNLQRGLIHQGSGDRVRYMLDRARKERRMKIAVLGGSVSVGHGCEDGSPIWHAVVGNWAKDMFGDVQVINGAVPATGSEFIKYCHSTLIPKDVDLIFIETALNDWKVGGEAVDDMEDIVRSLLAYPSSPAIIGIHFFKIDNRIETGADSQLALSNFYDYPVISARTIFLPKIMQDPEWRERYFRNAFDPMHPGCDGHRVIGDIVVAYLKDQLCRLNRPDLIIPPADLPFIPSYSQDDAFAIPRLRLVGAFDATTVEPPMEPTCISLHSRFSAPFQPIEQTGFDLWTAPGGEKKFWRGQTVGARISFDVTTKKGRILLYYQVSKHFDLGTVKCWLDDDDPLDSTKITTFVGYWELGMSIGRSAEIRSAGMKGPGKHRVNCEIIESTFHPTGGHSFLIIGLFSL